MLVLVKTNILAVGIRAKLKTLEKQLAVRIVEAEDGSKAVRSLKNEKIDSIIANWNLPDMPNGRFAKAVKTAKPYLPIIVITDAGNIKQEIQARSIGTTAVISSDIAENSLIRTICATLGVDENVNTQNTSAKTESIRY